jgi:hypothetical protein
MPSRARGVGPADSEKIARIIREHREAAGLSKPQLSARMFAEGYELSAAVLNIIENGASTSFSARQNGISARTRMISVDELKAFVHVLGIPPQVIIDWLYNT